MIRGTLASLGLVAALAGCETTTAGGGTITPEMRQDYLAAVASVGCVLRDERQYGAVDFQAGLTREQTVAITSGYVARGKAQRVDDGNSIRITTGPCAA
ncbi:hypothetical protein TRL7639_01532 [Falsiruegeria litorea R37]|uniref:NADH dehydrogenase subunit E n=1 Tax=Falsiruegeria litorea R37 TaxID=1200284 RepID=A0A1Y5S7F0_9RHOB|nr:hypothetical protein [Falsiruegeria litorea]SLN34068.1 hypothetical protein TRL7639_01532 [Falsiruegeria litorea R37]